MEQLATLGIVVDAKGAITQVRLLDTELNKLSNTSKRASGETSALTALHQQAVGHVGAHALGYGRLENALASFSAHALGVHPIIEKLSVSLGKFAIGSIEITAVLAGVAAIVALYDHITSSAREATKAQEEMLASARQAAYAAGPGGSNAAQQWGSARLNRIDLETRRATLEAYGQSTSDIDLQIRGARILEDNLFRNLPMGNLGTVTTTGRSQQEFANIAKRQAEEYQKAMAATYDFTRGRSGQGLGGGFYGDILNNLDSPLGRHLQNAMTVDGPTWSGSLANVGINDSLTKEQIKMREKMGILVDKTGDNTSILKGAIEGTAQIIGSIIAASLNIGGGGLGSQIGGALGSGIGGAAGAIFGAGKLGGYGGALFGPLGAVAGGLLGSALGGLFGSHKHAVDRNTQALNNLTASLSNAPSGFKVQYYNYTASEARRMYRGMAETARREATRGGRIGFQLRSA